LPRRWDRKIRATPITEMTICSIGTMLGPFDG
jgi:hypothetical protein